MMGGNGMGIVSGGKTDVQQPSGLSKKTVKSVMKSDTKVTKKYAQRKGGRNGYK